MLETSCTLPLTADLFAQAIHPSQPVLAVGLSTGHVQSFRIPALHSHNHNGTLTNGNTEEGDEEASDDDDNTSLLSQGRGEIATQWRTKRHEISCRALAYSRNSGGETLYSAGAEGIVKAASSETGRVFSKIAIPAVRNKGRSNDGTTLDACSVMHVMSSQTLLLATDHSSALHVYDLRSKDNGSFVNGGATRPSQTWYPHDEFISSITPLPASQQSTSGSAKQWISTGGTTLAVTDLRKGVIAQSADQDDELTASCFVSGLTKRGTSVGQKAVVGDSSGVLTLWERGVWDDIDERIVLDRSKSSTEDEGESIEVLVNVPREVSGSHATVAAGMGGGLVAWVQLGKNKVVEEYRHDEVEAVLALGFDVEGRMISGGGQVVKIWAERYEEEADEDEDHAEVAETNGVGNGSADDSEEDSTDASSSEDERPVKKRKKGGKATFGSFTGLD